jgi:hypothetical protein
MIFEEDPYIPDEMVGDLPERRLQLRKDEVRKKLKMEKSEGNKDEEQINEGNNQIITAVMKSLESLNKTVEIMANNINIGFKLMTQEVSNVMYKIHREEKEQVDNLKDTYKKRSEQKDKTNKRDWNDNEDQNSNTNNTYDNKNLTYSAAAKRTLSPEPLAGMSGMSMRRKPETKRRKELKYSKDAKDKETSTSSRDKGYVQGNLPEFGERNRKDRTLKRKDYARMRNSEIDNNIENNTMEYEAAIDESDDI